MPRTFCVVVLLLLSGCSKLEGPGPFPFVGRFDDYNETINGEVRFNYERETSFITVATRNSGLRCEGAGGVTYRPPLVVRAQDLICLGYQGIARLRCSDGRVLTGDWRAKSCNSGEGTGTDSTGAKFSFAFGMSTAEAQQYLASAQAELAQKPRFGEPSRPPGSAGSGTGFLVSADGLIVTNHHVIQGSNVIDVHQGGMVYRATVVARDAANDLAVLKSDVKGQPLRLASARESMRGDEVLTLGYPLGFVQGQAQKATFGRINALSGINDDSRFIQIDIPIQPGNSGGPLITRRGEVIGVVTQSLNPEFILDRVGTLPQNVNYAVKADYISILVPSLAQTGSANPTPEGQELADIVRASENSVFMIVAKSEGP